MKENPCRGDSPCSALPATPRRETRRDSALPVALPRDLSFADAPLCCFGLSAFPRPFSLRGRTVQSLRFAHGFRNSRASRRFARLVAGSLFPRSVSAGWHVEMRKTERAFTAPARPHCRPEVSLTSGCPCSATGLSACPSTLTPRPDASRSRPEVRTAPE